MKSVVRLDDAFFVNKDIEDYTTPGQQQQTQNTRSSLSNNIIISNDHPIKPSGNASNIKSWHEFGISLHIVYIFKKYKK